ncbi:MAG: iron-only hydrogenase system regulator [Erysipelotrichaceae bacterium]
MENRIALIGIMVEDGSDITKMNSILHEYQPYIIGRMGLPIAKENINVISIVVNAPNDLIASVAGKLGMLDHISVKTIYSKSKVNE